MGMADRAVVNVGQSWAEHPIRSYLPDHAAGDTHAEVEGEAEPLTLESAGDHLGWAVGER
jgi:hypothetical protein